MSKNPHEVPGNVLATAASVERVMMKTARSLYMTDQRVSDDLPNRVNLRQLRIKAPAQIGGEWFAVVTAYLEDAPVVAFHSGSSFVSTIEGVCNRINNGSLKWKDDEYA